jgi:hypothetical protein
LAGKRGKREMKVEKDIYFLNPLEMTSVGRGED